MGHLSHAITKLLTPALAGLACLFAAAWATGAQSAELLVVGRPSCPYCRVWEIQVGSIYDKTDESRVAPLHRVDISDVPDLRYEFREPVLYTPTFIVLERNMEVARIVGYSDDAAFWGLLDEILNKLRPHALNEAPALTKAKRKL